MIAKIQKSYRKRNIRNSMSKYLLLLVFIIVSACSGSKKTIVTADKILVSEFERDWLKFRVFLLPQSQSDVHNSKKEHGQKNMVFSIMIINMKDNASPLRKICGNLDEYNTYYEYLLNRCKENISLQQNGEIAYPVYYSFENNYNSFPFETINVGYRFKEKRRTNVPELVFDDKIFSHTILRFSLDKIKI